MIVGTAAVVVSIGCVPEDDGFHARVAAGCNTADACNALHDEAEARVKACFNAGGGNGAACNEQIRDRTATGEMLDHQRAANQAARGEIVQAERKRVSDEQGKYKDDEKRLGNSCEDIATLEATAAAIRQQEPSDPTCPSYERGMRGNGRDGRLTQADVATLQRCGPIGDRRRADEFLAGRYSTLAQQRRDDRVRAITGQLQGAMRRVAALPDMDDPSMALEDIPKTKALVDDLRCYDAGAAAKAQADVDVWATAREKAVADEKTCRVAPACMGARVAAPLCAAIVGRRGALQDIARERANPAGVVNLSVLHDLGQQIQDDDATIADLKAKYTATTHKPFSEASCPKMP